MGSDKRLLLLLQLMHWPYRAVIKLGQNSLDQITSETTENIYDWTSIFKMTLRHHFNHFWWLSGIQPNCFFDVWSSWDVFWRNLDYWNWYYNRIKFYKSWNRNCIVKQNRLYFVGSAEEIQSTILLKESEADS